MFRHHFPDGATCEAHGCIYPCLRIHVLTVCVQYQVERQGCTKEEADSSRYVMVEQVAQSARHTDPLRYRIKEVWQEEEVKEVKRFKLEAIIAHLSTLVGLQGVWC